MQEGKNYNENKFQRVTGMWNQQPDWLVCQGKDMHSGKEYRVVVNGFKENEKHPDYILQIRDVVKNDTPF